MDVFYYWKNAKADMDAGSLGWFRSSRDKLAELQEGAPDYLWVFRTPQGQKGQVQLLARLKWSDAAVTPVPREAGESYIYYDPDHPRSVTFTDSLEPAAIEAVSAWVKRQFPAAVRSNFQGENGQQALRGDTLRQLMALTSTWETRPFRVAAE